MTMRLQVDAGTTQNANSYVSVAEFKAYHTERLNSYSAYSDAAIDAAIVRATDYLDQRFRFVGERRNVAQRTAWPRIDAMDRDENLRYGVPFEIRDACCEYALIAAAQELLPTPDASATGYAVVSKSETVGPISESTTYAQGGYVLPIYPVADRRLIATGLVVSGGDIRRG